MFCAWISKLQALKGIDVEYLFSHPKFANIPNEICIEMSNSRVINCCDINCPTLSNDGTHQS